MYSSWGGVWRVRFLIAFTSESPLFWGRLQAYPWVFGNIVAYILSWLKPVWVVSQLPAHPRGLHSRRGSMGRSTLFCPLEYLLYGEIIFSSLVIALLCLVSHEGMACLWPWCLNLSGHTSQLLWYFPCECLRICTRLSQPSALSLSPLLTTIALKAPWASIKLEFYHLVEYSLLSLGSYGPSTCASSLSHLGSKLFPQNTRRMAGREIVVEQMTCITEQPQLRSAGESTCHWWELVGVCVTGFAYLWGLCLFSELRENTQ